MSKMLNIFIPATLLLSVLALSACATKPEAVPVAAPAPVEVVAEKPAAAEPVAAPAPAAIAEQPPVSAQATPEKKIRKARKMVAKPIPPQSPPPAPVAEPAPAVVATPAIVTPAPTPPVAVAPPAAKEIAETGFLEQYWLWLLGLLIAIAGVIFWWRKNQV